MNWNYVKIVTCLLAGAVLYMYFSLPNKIVIDNKGNIDGLINEIRASMQGKEFWKTPYVETIKEESQFQLKVESRLK